MPCPGLLGALHRLRRQALQPHHPPLAHPRPPLREVLYLQPIRLLRRRSYQPCGSGWKEDFFVSHSMGAAFSEGMADYLIEQGVPVEALIHFEPYQAARIESNGNMSNVMSIDYQDKQDWVIKYINGGEMPGSDYHIRTDSNLGWRYMHAHSISRESTWNEVRKYIFDLRNRNAKEQ